MPCLTELGFRAATLSPFSVHPVPAWSLAITDRPVLAKWLTGADATHPLLSPEMTDRFLDTLERIAAPVDAANPVRLPTKIKAFRTLKTRTELLEQRAELLIGSMLARGGVPFEFGKDHPDYVLADGELGIEVGSRALDGPWASHDRLEERLAARGSDAHVHLCFDDRPLKLGAARIEEIVDAVAGHQLSAPAEALRFTDAGLTVQLTRGAATPASRVALSFTSGPGQLLEPTPGDIHWHSVGVLRRSERREIPQNTSVGVAERGDHAARDALGRQTPVEADRQAVPEHKDHASP